jgi:hypothetical protein
VWEQRERHAEFKRVISKRKDHTKGLGADGELNENVKKSDQNMWSGLKYLRIEYNGGLLWT